MPHVSRSQMLDIARAALGVQMLAWRNTYPKMTLAEYLLLLNELITKQLETAIVAERMKDRR